MFFWSSRDRGKKTTDNTHGARQFDSHLGSRKCFESSSPALHLVRLQPLLDALDPLHVPCFAVTVVASEGRHGTNK